MENSPIETLDKDIINEVCSILMNNSANSFSKMVRDSVMIKTDIEFVSVTDFNMEFIFTKDFAEVFTGVRENLLEGYFLKTSEGAEGISVILFHQDNIDALISSIAKGMGSEKTALTQDGRDAILKEFSGIIIHAYLNALSRLMDADIDFSLPIPAKDILGSLYDFKQTLKEGHEDRALMIRTGIMAEQTGIKGKLIILLVPGTIKNILSRLKEKAQIG